MRRHNRHYSPSLEHERQLESEGFRYIAGIDEAGRGAWAGPVNAAAVILPLTFESVNALAMVDDSKTLSALQRERCRALITTIAVAIGVGSATCDEIDGLGIINATRLAMERAIKSLTLMPDALVIDALYLPSVNIRQDVFNFADSISLSVAAASIIAKTTRDDMMRDLDKKWPGYCFGAHKGYGTKAHHAALTRLGITSLHRRTYAPIKRLISERASVSMTVDELTC